ncbi:MAG: hypothetical protein ACLP9L_26915 [Thermoguttaceae bacterium]
MDRSARRQRLWEEMESCRSGSDDLSDPRFAELAARLAEDQELRGQFQRLQQADEAIRAAFVRVSVPAGLANRVSQHLAELAGLAELVPTTPSANQLAVSDSLEVPPVTTPAYTTPPETMPSSPAPLREASERASRRRLLVGLISLSAAAALLAAVWIQTHLPHETPNSVLVKAMDFFGEDNQPFGELVSRAAPPTGYPLSGDIVRLQGIRWRQVEKFLDGPAVAYDLPTIRGRATLYVVQRNVAGLPSFPPPTPLSTGGKSAAAWQAENTLYVLVVEGDAGMYSSYLDQSHGPLT